MLTIRRRYDIEIFLVIAVMPLPATILRRRARLCFHFAIEAKSQQYLYTPRAAHFYRRDTLRITYFALLDMTPSI